MPHPSEPHTGSEIVHLLRTTQWLTRDQHGWLTLVDITQLGLDQRRQIRHWLRQQASRLYARSIVEAWSQYQGGDIDRAELDRRLAPLKDRDPHTWLADTPLVRALDELTPQPGPWTRLLPRHQTGGKR